MIDPQRKPHRHAAIIKAWADGAEIEFLTASNGWVSCPSPLWDARYHYRVKPTPHKWQKEFDALMAGKTVQWSTNNGCTWIDWAIGNFPLFEAQFKDGKTVMNNRDYIFRIRPEVVKVKGEAYPNALGGAGFTISAKPNLELTFEDGKLIAAKVLPS